MEWQDLRSLLERTRKILGTEIESRKDIAATVSGVLKVDIDERTVRIRGRKVVFDVHPAIKNEILLRKEELLTQLHRRGLTRIEDLG